jgi:accessory colonization factor AcfC
MRLSNGALAILIYTISAHGAELKVLSLPPLRAALIREAPLFEKATGHKVSVQYGTPPQLAKRLKDVDVVMATPEVTAGF